MIPKWPLYHLILVIFLTILQIKSITAAKQLDLNRCEKNTIVINDCNLCRCGSNHKFTCTQRSCANVDMFGHFKDAIREINVGMEGKGFWRSSETVCEPGVQYRRGGVLCVCGEDGSWPNPVCRDIFQILHTVEVPEDSKIQSCSPSKLYLIGCNVCICPSTGQIDYELCTKKACLADDPALKVNDEVTEKETEPLSQDIYAECTPNLKYKVGCQECTCLRNNRLLCDNCTLEKKAVKQNYCNGKRPLEIFNDDCNVCYCDEKGNMICSVKRCLRNENLQNKLSELDLETELVDAPYDHFDCVVGTKYKKNCNTCHCLKNEKGDKVFACSLKSCVDSASSNIVNNCVPGTSYESNCLKCQCEVRNHEKWQVCETSSRCNDTEMNSQDFNLLHGYCEPLHVYRNDCNTCTCLLDGKRVKCTDKICERSDLKPISAEIIPVKQNLASCPKGHSYKVDCNYCVCLNNGNAMCTLMGC